MSLLRRDGLAGLFLFVAVLCWAHGSALAATAYESAVLALRPVGFWLLNETNGTIAFDSSGNGNNGAYLSMMGLGVPGVPNQPFSGFASNSLAASFNGVTNSWVTLSNLPVNSANLTITAWIYPTDSGSLGTILWNNSHNSGLGDYYTTPSELGYNWNGDANTWGYQSGLFPPVKQWSFVAMVITPANTVFYMGSMNGVLCSATNHEPNAAANFTVGSVIGSVGSASPSTSFIGSMSDVAIFNFSLTPDQITQLYFHSNTNIGAPPPVVTGLRTTAGNALVSLSWNTAAWETSYCVKRSTNSGGEVTITCVTGTSYIDSGLTNGTTYYYVVSATNAAGESADSPEVSTTPLDGAPVACNIVFVGDSITFGWTLPNRVTQSPAVQCMETLNQRFNVDVSMSNQGHPGHTTADWRPSTNPSSDFQLAIDAATSLESSQPGQLIFSIMLGANDSGQSISATDYRHNLQSTISQFLSNFPSAYIFVHYPTWYSTNTENNALALEKSYFPEIDELISNCATLYPGHIFAGDKGQAFNYFSANYFNTLTHEVGSQGPLFLHPNSAGAAALGQFWANAMAPALNFPVPLPSPWMTSDIGNVGVAGSACACNGGAFTVTGGGSGVWDEPTAFRYMYQTLTNSGCSIVAKVANFNVAEGTAPAGVMISETLTGAGKHALVCTSKSSGTAFICATNGNSSFIPFGGSASGNVSYWVKLARTNNIFYAYTSADGSSWTATGTQAMTMSNIFYIGLAASSSNNGTTGTATFTNVAVLGMSAVLPAVPRDFTVMAHNAQTTLAWRVSPGAASYNVKRSKVSGAEVTVTNVSEASYTDTELADGTTYYYVVSATNSEGESANSSEVSATPFSEVVADGIH
jgi:lysophospholipase L1-like esterase